MLSGHINRGTVYRTEVSDAYSLSQLTPPLYGVWALTVMF